MGPSPARRQTPRPPRSVLEGPGGAVGAVDGNPHPAGDQGCPLHFPLHAAEKHGSGDTTSPPTRCKSWGRPSASVSLGLPPVKWDRDTDLSCRGGGIAYPLCLNEDLDHLPSDLALSFLTDEAPRSSSSPNSGGRPLGSMPQWEPQLPSSTRTALSQRDSRGTDPKTVIDFECPPAQTHPPAPHILLNKPASIFSALGTAFETPVRGPPSSGLAEINSSLVSPPLVCLPLDFVSGKQPTRSVWDPQSQVLLHPRSPATCPLRPQAEGRTPEHGRSVGTALGDSEAREVGV